MSPTWNLRGDLALAESARAALPALIVLAGEKAAWRFLEFFTFNMRKREYQACGFLSARIYTHR
jgi:hypothetical protein